MYWCDFGNIMGWGNGVSHMIFWILIIGFALMFISRWIPQQKRNSDAADSMDILKRRLASGEISFDEYEKLKKAM